MGDMIDAGGAAVRRRADLFSNRTPRPQPENFAAEVEKLLKTRPSRSAEIKVVVRVAETHDGELCDCIDDEERTLGVGDELVLTHVCHDGRVDRVVATVLRTEVATSERQHGTAEVRRAGD